MDLEEKILMKGIKLFSLWFVVMILFVWEEPKPKIQEEIESEYSFVPDEEYLEVKEKNEDWSKVTVTVYNPVTEQCDSSPLITADNSKIDLEKLKQGKLKWVAVSRDLLKNGKVKYGGKVRLKSKDKSMNGVYTVHDTMHPRWEKRVDILAHQDIKTAGKQENVEIEYLD